VSQLTRRGGVAVVAVVALLQSFVLPPASAGAAPTAPAATAGHEVASSGPYLPAGFAWLRDARWTAMIVHRVAGRSATADEVEAVTSGLADHDVRYADITRWYQSTADGRAVTVTELYANTLHRVPDQGGLTFWSNRLAQPGETMSTIRADVFGSYEWFLQAGGTNAGFIDQLYHYIMLRAPDPSGRALWLWVLDHGASRLDVATSFIASKEGRLLRTADAYRQVLHRDPDPAGAEFWSEQLRTVDDLTLRAILTGAAEVLDQAATTALPAGLTPPNGVGDCGTPPPTDPAAWRATYRQLHGRAWSGGDGGASAPLDGGAVLFVHGDTAQGDVDADGRRSLTGFVHNTMVVAVGGCLIPITGPDFGAVIPDAADGHYYWPAAPIVDGNDMWVPVARMRTTHPGTWGFAQDGIDLAHFSLAGGRVPTYLGTVSTPMSNDTVVAWGNGEVRVAGWWYVYGVAADGTGDDVFAARVPAGRLGDASAWQFWGAGSWRADPSAITPVLAPTDTPTPLSPSMGLSVVQRPSGKFVMITKNYNVFSNEIVAWVASTPLGPWTPSGTPTELPVEHSSFGQTLSQYSVAAHPSLSTGDDLLVSWFNLYFGDDAVPDEAYAPYGPFFTTIPVPD
jgi:hypothetical protein